MLSNGTSVDASFVFLADLPVHKTEKPYEIWCESDPQFPKSNCVFEEHNHIRVDDMRQFDHGFGYENYGFRPVYWPSSANLKGNDCTSSDGSGKLMHYLQETASLVQNEFVAEKVICFDWRVRKPETRKPPSMTDTSISSTAKLMVRNIYMNMTTPRQTELMRLARRMWCTAVSDLAISSLSFEYLQRLSDDSADGGKVRLLRHLNDDERNTLESQSTRVRFIK